MQLAIDATVAKPPFSGVQLAVLNEANAVSTLVPDTCVFGTVQGMTPQPCWARRTTGRILWQQLALPHTLQRLRAEALLALAYTCPIRCKCPVILHVHDVIALDHPELCSTLNALHIKTLLPPSVKRADVIVVSTNYVAERLSAHFPAVASKTHVVNLGVDYDFFASPKPRPNALSAAPYFLFVGNIEPKKGLPTLLKAFESIAPTYNAKLVLAGRIAWKSTGITQEIARLQQTLPGRLLTLGRVPSEQLPALYQHAAAFVFPSTEEGFGLPVLEAMAAGTPVIHSSHPALLEASGGNGIPFETNNSNALADAMLSCLNTPSTLQETIAKGRLHAQAHSWSRWAENVVSILSHTIRAISIAN